MKHLIKPSLLLIAFFASFVDSARAGYDPTIGRWLSTDPIGEAGGPNLYAYVGNGPIDAVDPLGLEITYANHPVALNMNHSKLVITPENQARYTNDPRFQQFDSNGKRFATIGAGPEHGKLIYAPNREKDVVLPCDNKIILKLPDRYKNEDKAIDLLFKMAENYNNTPLRYKLFPSEKSKSYNSNSFIIGIGQAAGFSMPSETGAKTPGYYKPVPPSAFPVK